MPIRDFVLRAELPLYSELKAAQYSTGGALDQLLELAMKTEPVVFDNFKPDVAECEMGDETVLVVRGIRYAAEFPPQVHWLIVRNEEWLYYNEETDLLGTLTTQELERYYTPAEKEEA